MSYLSLARKYRPNTFQDLVGQESAALALANAIRLKREPRGVIFTGVRGIGKTTTARIYAKALNCEKGPTPEPCNVCSSCVAIQQGTHEDVLEIDGASNTGVDDVRALQETLAYVPQRSSFKIYIIDEVHMLSVSAFNALLKTLEEPPEHVVFIFATTELHKVPETIQSRCQIFHLQKISTQLTKKRIVDILTNEGIAFEDRAVQWIAREGKGSLRDALTLLDQVIAVGGGSVPWSAVEPMVNTGHAEPIYELLSLLLTRDSAGLLAVIARWDQEGLAMATLVEELVKACRNAFVLKSLNQSATELELLDLEDRELEVLKKLGSEAQVLDLNRIFRSFVKCLDDLRNSELDRFVVENYALEWCLDPGLPDITTLMQGGFAAAAAKPAPSGSPRAPSAGGPQASGSTVSADPADPMKVQAPAMDLRNRWKQASGQAATNPAPAPAPAPAPRADVKPQPTITSAAQAPAPRVDVKPIARIETTTQVSANITAAPSARGETSVGVATQAAPAPRFEAPIKTNAAVNPNPPSAEPAPLQTKLGASVASDLSPAKPHSHANDQWAAKAIVQNHGTQPAPQPSAPPATKAETDDDLPPWLTEDEGLDSYDETEELSIISQISSQAHDGGQFTAPPSPKITSAKVHEEPPKTPAPAASPAPAAPQSAKDRLESLLEPAKPAPAKPAEPEALAKTAGKTPENWPATWKDFVDQWKKQKPLQARVLEETYAIEYTPARIKLAVESESLAGQKLLHIDTRKKLLTHFEALFGFKGLFEVVPKSELVETEAAPQETLLETKQKIKAKERDDLKSLLENHPLTREALQEFGGTIESIEVQ